MTIDINAALADWEFDPNEVTVRTIIGDDGLEKIQLRLDLGILQMEVDGRPDGKQIEGFDSWLSFHESLQREHDAANPDGVPYLLRSEDCDELMREGVQYYHRYVSFWSMKRYELCARDTERNLRLFHFVRNHAEYDRDKLQFDQWRPYVTMMHTRAVATPLVDLRQTEAAILAIEAGIERINQFLVDYGQEAQAEKVNELTYLKRWRRKLKKGETDSEEGEESNEDDPVSQLEEELSEAVKEEDYERAAALRDQLNRLENPPPPAS